MLFLEILGVFGENGPHIWIQGIEIHTYTYMYRWALSKDKTNFLCAGVQTFFSEMRWMNF